MNESERDTHFKGFAKLLYQELSDLNGGYETIISEDLNEKEQQEQLQIIAQRAYDLVYHALDSQWTVHNPTAVLENIPDLTAWPKIDPEQGGTR